MRQGTVIDSATKITPLGLKNSSAKIFPVNTVLVAMYGATAGQVGILGVSASTNQAVCGILPNNKIVPIYLFNYLKTQYNNLLSLRSGVARLNISQKIIQNFKIPLPPINIQQSIVNAILLIEKQGQDAAIKIGELNQKIDSIINNVFQDTTKTESLGNLAEIKNGGTPSTRKSEYWDGDIHWATLVDTKAKYLHSTQRKISQAGMKHSSAVLLPINTVIFSSRATIGDVCISKIATCTNQGYKNFICDESKLHYEFLYYVLKKEAKNIEALASGMTYKEISKTLISEFKIPVPSLDIQKRVVNQIKAIETEVEQLNNILSGASVQKELILKKYLN